MAESSTAACRQSVYACLRGGATSHHIGDFHRHDVLQVTVVDHSDEVDLFWFHVHLGKQWESTQVRHSLRLAVAPG